MKVSILRWQRLLHAEYLMLSFGFVSISLISNSSCTHTCFTFTSVFFKSFMLDCTGLIIRFHSSLNLTGTKICLRNYQIRWKHSQLQIFSFQNTQKILSISISEKITKFRFIQITCIQKTTRLPKKRFERSSFILLSNLM